jgi:hypothetical protein
MRTHLRDRRVSAKREVAEAGSTLDNDFVGHIDPSALDKNMTSRSNCRQKVAICNGPVDDVPQSVSRGRNQNVQRAPSKFSRHEIRASMRTVFIAVIIALLSCSAVLADPANHTKPDYATPLDRLPPAKTIARNPCAAFGSGFVKVEGTDTCVKMGGSFRIDVSGPAGSR